MVQKIKKKKEKQKEKAQEKQNVAFSVDELKTTIEGLVAKHGSDLTPEQVELQKKALEEIIIEGKSPLEAMKLPREICNVMYQQAYNLYNMGLYEKANHVFRVLCLLDYGSPKYQLGLAATNHQMHNYEVAIDIYVIAFLLQPNSPLPLYYISDCYTKLNRPEASYIALTMAAKACGDAPEYEKIKTRCYMTMESIKKQLKMDKSEQPIKGVPEGEMDIFSQLQTEAKKKH